MAEISEKAVSEVKQSWISFQTSRGTEVQATPLRLNRHQAVFELYSPNVVLQTSEVLGEFTIVCQDRTLFSGRAVVQNLVNTGLMVVCDAALDDGWRDVDFVVAAGHGDKLCDGFKDFVRDWEKLYRVLPEFKSAIADLQTFLTDLRLWLEQVELGVRSAPAGDRVELERTVAHELQGPAVESIQSLCERYEAVSRSIGADLQPVHQAFARRQLHPLMLCSPFIYRTLRKPLGYAGDYEVVNMMFRDPCEGSSLFAKIMNAYALQLPPIVAHRHRIAYLVERLQAETLRAARSARKARILDVGCGPAHEIQNFLRQNSLCDQAQFTLVDFEEEALAYVGKTLEALKKQHGRQTAIELKRNSVLQILKESAKSVQGANGNQFDFAYCAGLFDYLPDRVCRQIVELLYQKVAPGGLVVVTNVDQNPSRIQMESFLEWHLIYRSAERLAKLAPEYVSPEAVSLKCDGATGVNIFLEIRKPERV